MKQRFLMVAVIVLAVLLSLAMGILVTQVSAAEHVLWKQTCPAYADLTIVPEGMDRHVVCTVGDSDVRAK